MFNVVIRVCVWSTVSRTGHKVLVAVSSDHTGSPNTCSCSRRRLVVNYTGQWSVVSQHRSQYPVVVVVSALSSTEFNACSAPSRRRTAPESRGQPFTVSSLDVLPRTRRCHALFTTHCSASVATSHNPRCALLVSCSVLFMFSIFFSPFSLPLHVHLYVLYP